MVFEHFLEGKLLCLQLEKCCLMIHPVTATSSTDKDSGTSNWVIADQTGVIGDSGISANTQSFLVVRIDFAPGNENVWLWVDPLLSSTPQTSDADASSTTMNFVADFLRVQLEVYGPAGFDEIRLGTTFSEAMPYSPVIPEPGSRVLLGMGLFGLTVASRRTTLRRE